MLAFDLCRDRGARVFCEFIIRNSTPLPAYAVLAASSAGSASLDGVALVLVRHQHDGLRVREVVKVVILAVLIEQREVVDVLGSSRPRRADEQERAERLLPPCVPKP